MLNLSASDRAHLRTALTSGFRNYSSLKIFVSDNFEDLRLNEISPSTATRDAAEALIEHFEEQGDVVALILALYRERSRNPDVQALVNRVKGFFQQRLILDPEGSDAGSLPFNLPETYSDTQLESFLPRPLSYEADVGELQRGLQLANAVCKVAFTDRGTTGTGVLIAPDLVLTNYHVLSCQVLQERSQLVEKTKTLLFEFGFVSEEHDTPMSPDTFNIGIEDPVVVSSPPAQLDYVLLRVEQKIKNADHIRPVPIPSNSPSLASQNGLNVLQHPGGSMMQVSLSASGVVQVSPEKGRIWYVNRTQGGSSGSPCFNSAWQIVALHHAAMSRGFGSVGEGILISSILAEISGFLR